MNHNTTVCVEYGLDQLDGKYFEEEFDALVQFFEPKQNLEQQEFCLEPLINDVEKRKETTRQFLWYCWKNAEHPKATKAYS